MRTIYRPFHPIKSLYGPFHVEAESFFVNVFTLLYPLSFLTKSHLAYSSPARLIKPKRNTPDKP